jgi:hypothetical protein
MKMPDSMKAAVQTRFGSPNGLKNEEVERPEFPMMARS